MSWLRRRVRAMHCDEVAQVLQRYIDHEVAPDTARLVTLHLRRCRLCVVEHDVYLEIKEALRRRGDEAVDPQVLAQLQQFCDHVVSGRIAAEPDER